jgi:hypothetical protein
MLVVGVLVFRNYDVIISLRELLFSPQKEERTEGG